MQLARIFSVKVDVHPNLMFITDFGDLLNDFVSDVCGYGWQNYGEPRERLSVLVVDAK